MSALAFLSGLVDLYVEGTLTVFMLTGLVKAGAFDQENVSLSLRPAEQGVAALSKAVALVDTAPADYRHDAPGHAQNLFHIWASGRHSAT